MDLRRGIHVKNRTGANRGLSMFVMQGVTQPTTRFFYKKIIILPQPRFLTFPEIEPEIFLNFSQLLLK